MTEKPSIIITENGPYIVKGAIPLSQDVIAPAKEGHHLEYYHVKNYEVKDEYHLCRCGQSGHKPFCDGTHAKVGFDGAEVAARVPYDERAQIYEGPAVDLGDDNRCAFARLCHREDGDVWTLTEEAGGGALKQEAVAASWHCPTGRLQHRDSETGEVYEQRFDMSIVILEAAGRNASGPLFVRGGVPLIGADGFQYEVRNRYALCRCGGSSNKPFCDATHVTMGFDDGSEALQSQWGGRDDSFDELPQTS